LEELEKDRDEGITRRKREYDYEALYELMFGDLE
jgi:hypothetical protein